MRVIQTERSELDDVLSTAGLELFPAAKPLGTGTEYSSSETRVVENAGQL